MILGEPFSGRSNRANDFPTQIRLTLNPVVKFSGNRIIKQPVDGEVAPACVSPGIAERDPFGVSAVPVIGFGAEGGNLELPPPSTTMSTPNFRPTGIVRVKNLLDLVRQSRVTMS